MIRLGVIGHGKRIGSVIRDWLRDIEPDVRVVGIVDPNEEFARSFLDPCDQDKVVFYENLDEMVRKAKPDALAIGTQCDLHAPYAIEAARYDMPLYLEKPVATSMEQAISLEHAFENSKCKVVVSFPMRLSTLTRYAHKRVEEGAIGNPEHIMAWCYPPVGTNYFDKPYRNFKTSGGLFLQKATHDFDCISYMMNSNIIRVCASWTQGRVFGGSKPAGLICSECDEADTCLESPQIRKRNSPDRVKGNQMGGRTEDHQCLFCEDIGTPETGMNEDSSSVLLEFDSGVHGVYTQVFYARRVRRRGFTVSGYDGTLRLDWYKGIDIVKNHWPITERIGTPGNVGHHGGDAELAWDFINLIRGKITEPRTPVWEGIQSVYACIAARESAQKGMFIDVRQVGALR